MAIWNILNYWQFSFFGSLSKHKKTMWWRKWRSDENKISIESKKKKNMMSYQESLCWVQALEILVRLINRWHAVPCLKNINGREIVPWNWHEKLSTIDTYRAESIWQNSRHTNLVEKLKLIFLWILLLIPFIHI